MPRGEAACCHRDDGEDCCAGRLRPARLAFLRNATKVTSCSQSQLLFSPRR